MPETQRDAVHALSFAHAVVHVFVYYEGSITPAADVNSATRVGRLLHIGYITVYIVCIICSSRSCICRYHVLRGICAAQIQRRKHVPHLADHPALSRRNDLYAKHII